MGARYTSNRSDRPIGGCDHRQIVAHSAAVEQRNGESLSRYLQRFLKGVLSGVVAGFIVLVARYLLAFFPLAPCSLLPGLAVIPVFDLPPRPN